MKVIVLVFILISMFCSSIWAQTTTYQKVAEVYGEAFIDNNPTLFQSFSKLLEDRITYLQKPEEADEKYPKISTLELKNKNNPDLKKDENFDMSTFNPLKYGIQMFASTTQVYRIDNTDFLIVVEPQK